jgi:hypothetical protein
MPMKAEGLWRSPLSVRLGGGCPCDAVRFEITEVFDAGYCHCNRCRKSTGAPVFAFVRVPRAAFDLLSGELLAEKRLGQGIICVFVGGASTSIWASETCYPLASAGWMSLPVSVRLSISA